MTFLKTIFSSAILFSLYSCNPATELDDDFLNDPSAVSSEVINPINDTLINPKHITATSDSTSKISLFWLAGESSLSDYQISWATGTTPPSTCLTGNIITSSSITGETYQLTGITTPYQDIAFRVCVIDSDGKLSEGSTVVQKTFPTCDNIVSANETFTDFQTRIDAASDMNADGKVAICIDDGVSITTNNSGEGGQIEINTSNVYIYADRSSTVSFENNRIDTTSPTNNSIFYLRAADNFSIANISLTTDGDYGHCIHTWSTARVPSAYNEISNIQFSTTGYYARGLVTSSRDTDSIKDITFTSTGINSRAIDSAGIVSDIRKFTINAANICNGGCAMGFGFTSFKTRNVYWGSITAPQAVGINLYDSSIENLVDVNIVTDRTPISIRLNAFITNATDLYLESNGDWTGSALSLGQAGAYITKLENVVIVKNGKGNTALYITNDSYIDSMKNIQIRRNAAAITGTAQAIYINDTGWVNTANVSNIEVCSETGSIAWEDYSTTSRGLLDGSSASPAAHVPYVAATTLGAQTFPFDVLNGSGAQSGAITDKNIILGGTCSN